MKEGKRGCGYRKCGATYLIGKGIAIACDRLPMEITNCPTCGGGIKFTRSFQWINFKKYAGNHEKCTDPKDCFVCYPHDEPYGLMWVGNAYYSPETLITEAGKQGVCKRISNIPKDLEFGKTRILLAHKKAVAKEVDSENTLTGKQGVKVPGIFYAFIPTKIEKIVTNVPDNKIIERFEKRGVTLLLAKGVDEKGNVMETEVIERVKSNVF